MREEVRLKRGRDGGLGARRRARGKVEARTVRGAPALEGAKPDGDGRHDLLARHTPRDGVHHALTPIERITTHTGPYLIGSLFLPTAVVLVRGAKCASAT